MTDAEIKEIAAIAEAVAAKTLTLDNCAAWPEMDHCSLRPAVEAADSQWRKNKRGGGVGRSGQRRAEFPALYAQARACEAKG
jgi:hypothetical protein